MREISTDVLGEFLQCQHWLESTAILEEKTHKQNFSWIVELEFRSRSRDSCSSQLRVGSIADRNCFRQSLADYFRYECGQSWVIKGFSNYTRNTHSPTMVPSVSLTGPQASFAGTLVLLTCLDARFDLGLVDIGVSGWLEVSGRPGPASTVARR